MTLCVIAEKTFFYIWYLDFVSEKSVEMFLKMAVSLSKSYTIHDYSNVKDQHQNYQSSDIQQ